MAKENTSKRSRIFLDPLLKANPLFVMVLGTCPALAVTTSFESAIGMGLLFTFVVFFSNLLISALRKVIPEEVETPAYIVIIATFVTIVKILTSTFLPELYNSLGVFVSLLVVNCIVLGRAEAFANKNGVVDSMLDGLGNGLGYTWAIAVIALFREVVGAGTLTFGKTFTFIPQITIPILGGFKGTNFSLAIPLFKSSAGGFLVLGFALAILAAVNNYKKHKAQEALKAQKAKEAEARKAALAAKAAAKPATAAEGGK
ncbi:electron transport complex subunit RsxE [bacterium]|nr:electron transport complex subunit RsxE [bacterium]MDY2686833.1 electron transport complex subunit RsxE [Candidatus Enteromonas sp.]MDY5298038.1 electron transport complex subunit RsxE [Candidatus Enteromonas sp.]